MNIDYLNRDFSSIRNTLIKYIKEYYPNTYSDFNESSPGMMFIELVSYVGDILSFYTDYNYKESKLLTATEYDNVVDLAYSIGYKPKGKSPSRTVVDVFQLIPAKNVGGKFVPDYDYALVIKPGMVVASEVDSSAIFYSLHTINFKEDSYYSPTEVTLYEKTGNTPTFFLLKKSAIFEAGQIGFDRITVDSYKPFRRIALSERDIFKIISVRDSQGNDWYETDYLSNDTIYEIVYNDKSVDELISEKNRLETPFLYRKFKTSKRFIKRNRKDKTELIFGDGHPNDNASTMIDVSKRFLSGQDENAIGNFNPTSFMYTSAFGEAPRNTTLDIKYIFGGGLSTNVPSNEIRTIISYENYNQFTPAMNQALYDRVLDSLAINNPIAATGGADEETIDEIKANAIYSFSTQNRAVTLQDYESIINSMPSELGRISKSFVVHNNDVFGNNKNPYNIGVYVLGTDKNGNFCKLNRYTKENLSVHLQKYKMLTDSIIISDAEIINIGINFSVSISPVSNKSTIFANVLNVLKDYFKNENMKIGAPIYIDDIIKRMLSVDKVQSVADFRIQNIYGPGYSPVYYDMNLAIKNRILYPSRDPSIFEVKYPDKDIFGKIVVI